MLPNHPLPLRRIRMARMLRMRLSIAIANACRVRIAIADPLRMRIGIAMPMTTRYKSTIRDRAWDAGLSADEPRRSRLRRGAIDACRGMASSTWPVKSVMTVRTKQNPPLDEPGRRVMVSIARC